MANLPEQFPIPTPDAIASFDYTDIAEGTGLVILYGTDFRIDGSTISYGLIKNPQRSTTLYTDVSSGTPSYNFDLSAFNLPKVVKGTAYFSACVYGTPESNGYIRVQLKKYDGTTETNVSTQVSEVFGNTSTNRRVFFKLPCTETHFKKGEILRLTISGDGTGGRFYHDPINSSGADPTQTLRIDVPFKIID